MKRVHKRQKKTLVKYKISNTLWKRTIITDFFFNFKKSTKKYNKHSS